MSELPYGVADLLKQLPVGADNELVRALSADDGDPGLLLQAEHERQDIHQDLFQCQCMLLLSRGECMSAIFIGLAG